MFRHMAILAIGGTLTMSAWACTCAGIATFMQTIEDAPIVIEGRVTAFDPVKSAEQYGAAQVAVDKVLKGKFAGKSVPTQVILVDPMMCYRSITSEELAHGETYILALLPTPTESAQTRKRKDKAVMSPASISYRLNTCAETALLRQGDRLFTFKRAKELGNQPQPVAYGDYRDFLQQIDALKTQPPPRPDKPRQYLPSEYR